MPESVSPPTAYCIWTGCQTPRNRTCLRDLPCLTSPAPWTPLVRLDSTIERRHMNRPDFFDQDVPPDVIYKLTTAAEQEEASLVKL